MDKLCFERETFNMYLFILFLLIVYFIYFLHSYYFNNSLSQKNKWHEEKEEMIEKIKKEMVERMKEIKQGKSEDIIQNKFLDKIYNPMSGTSSTYSGNYDSYNIYQNVGFISNNLDQFPIYGRYHEKNRSDRWEYYTINESRNKIKIPIKTKNRTELYNNDNVNIPEFGGDLTFTIYEDTDTNRYQI